MYTGHTTLFFWPFTVYSPTSQKATEIYRRVYTLPPQSSSCQCSCIPTSSTSIALHIAAILPVKYILQQVSTQRLRSFHHPCHQRGRETDEKKETEAKREKVKKGTKHMGNATVSLCHSHPAGSLSAWTSMCAKQC